MRWHLVAVLLMAVACRRGESAHCVDESTTPLELNEPSPIEATGWNVAWRALTGSPWAETLRWATGETTPMTLAFSDPIATRYVDRAAVYPEWWQAEPIPCGDAVEVELPVTLATDDGAFDESWDVTLRGFQDNEVSWMFVETDPDALNGTYEVGGDVDASDADDATVVVWALFDGEATGGRVVIKVPDEVECTQHECGGAPAVATWGDLLE